MSPYDTLAHEYDAGRIGYAPDLYRTLVEYGVEPDARILDVACGTGLASRPFAENAYHVTGVDRSEAMLEVARKNVPAASWVHGDAYALPFDAASFDVAISAQTFHSLDRAAALREMTRVLRPNGIVAIWWKLLLTDDPFNVLRERVARELGVEPPPQGLVGGFKEFYAADLRERTVRIVPWSVAIGVEQLIVGERSRARLRDALGSKAAAYFQRLESELRALHSGGNPLVTLSYLQYLYLGRT